MRRLKSQLVLYFKSSKYFIILIFSMIMLCLIGDMLILKGKSTPTSLFSINTNMIIIYLPALCTVVRSNFQYIVSMGLTRKDYFKGAAVFYILLSLTISTVLVLCLLAEHGLYQLSGHMHIADFYKIITFDEISISKIPGLIIFFFSVMLGIIGFFHFIFSIITSYVNGLPVILATVTVFIIVYYLIIFGRLNTILINLFVRDFGPLLYLKLTAAGLSGILLSWPFISNVENFNTDWKIKKY